MIETLNLSMIQIMNQSMNQTMNQTMIQTMNQTMKQAMNQTMNQTMSQTMNEHNEPINRLLGCFAGVIFFVIVHTNCLMWPTCLQTQPQL